jgi:PAS domain S-box-containing protein
VLQALGTLIGLLALCAGAWAKTLKVGVYNNPPSIHIDQQGKPQGLYADLIEEIARQEGWTLDYVVDEWLVLYDKLKFGQIDLLTSISYSEERDKIFDFADEPVAIKWGTVYLPIDSRIRIIPDLHHKRVAVLKGGIHGQNFSQVSADFGIEPRIIETGSLGETLRMVEQGVVDAGVVNSTFGYLKEEEYRVERSAIAFHPTRSTFAVPQGRHGETLATINRYLAEWRKDQSSIYYETYNRWYGGKEYVKEVVPQWLLILLGGVLGAILLFALWTKTLKLQVAARTRELNESNLRFRQLVDNLREVFWISSPDKHEMLYVSPAYETIWGSSCESLYAEPSSFLEAIHPEDRQRVIDAFPKQLQGTYDETYRLLHKDGSIRWIRDRAFPVPSDQGHVERVVGIAEEITDQVEREERVEIANRTKTAFLSNMSHELRTPLNGVLGFAYILGQDQSLSPKHREMLNCIETSGKYLLTLLTDILDFANIQAVRIACVAEELATERFFHDVAEVYRYQAEYKGLRFEYQPDQSLPAVIHADPKRLRQVLTNLLGNALKFTDEGNIRMQVRYGQGRLHIRISDTGCGITAAQHKQIFDPFTKAYQDPSNPDLTTTDGVGLGLAITRKIVELMDGTIDLDSTPGMGSCFFVSIPVRVISPGPGN